MGWWIGYRDADDKTVLWTWGPFATLIEAKAHARRAELDNPYLYPGEYTIEENTGNLATEAASKVASDQPLPCRSCGGKGQTVVTGEVEATETYGCAWCNGTGIAK